MGVSLERVQFKFASIVGELCSEPDVLSQFAVWLDLRLAEYKLKGAISLDCSGEEPDPIWLKGLNKHKPAGMNTQSDKRSQHHSPAAARGSSAHHRSAQQTSVSDISISHSHTVPSMDLSERLSPDVLVVKEEPEDVFPVALHENSGVVPVSGIKRSAAESSGHWSTSMSPSRSKIRRVSSKESPSNQSLMTVIGDYSTGDDQEEVQSSETMGDNSVSGPSSGTPGAYSMAASSSISKSTELQSEHSGDLSDSTLSNEQLLQEIRWASQQDSSSCEAGPSNSNDSNIKIKKLAAQTAQEVVPLLGDPLDVENYMYIQKLVSESRTVQLEELQEVPVKEDRKKAEELLFPSVTATESWPTDTQVQLTGTQVQPTPTGLFESCAVLTAKLDRAHKEIEDLKKSAYQYSKDKPGDYIYSRPKAGFHSEEVAEQFKMVPLLPGSGIFLHADQMATVLQKSPDGSISGQSVARRLMGILFSQKEMLEGTLSEKQGSPLTVLNQDLTSTIIVLDMFPGDMMTGHAGPSFLRPLRIRDSFKVTKPERDHRRSKLRNVASMPKSVVVNLVVGAGIFERWLWESPGHVGKPSVETLDPTTLNRYLIDFFSTIKRPDGTDYKRRSLESIRSNLDRYLRETGYGESIISSPMFAESQLAYRQRIRTLF